MKRTEPDWVGYLLLLRNETASPGWYVRYGLAGRVRTTRLEVNGDADAFEAATEASGFLGCPIQNIQIEVDSSIFRLFPM